MRGSVTSYSKFYCTSNNSCTSLYKKKKSVRYEKKENIKRLKL